MTLNNLFLFLFVIFIYIICVLEAIEIEVNPPSVLRIPEETETTLQITLRFNQNDLLDQHLNRSDSTFAITPLPDQHWKLSVESSDLIWTEEEIRDEINKTFTVSGFYWGYTQLIFYLAINDVSEELMPGAPMLFNYTIIVDRKSRMMDNIFMGCITVFVLIITTLMGCQLDVAVIWAVIKTPIGPIVGLISQFAFMPLFSFWVGSVLFDDALLRLGLFTLGCCPGGTGSNFWTLMFHGDLNLSITMTFTSIVVAMGMMPFWMYTLGANLLEENSNVRVPFLNLIMSLLMLTIPVGIGMFLKYRKPIWAKKSEKVVRPLTFGMILFLLTFGMYNSYKVFLMMTTQIVIAGTFVTIGGYCFGAIFASIFCRPWNQVIAISIETAFQNGSVAFILLKLSLPTPESDMASVPVLAQLFQTGPPLLIIYLMWMIIRRCNHFIKKKKGTYVEDAPDDVDIEVEIRPEFVKKQLIENPDELLQSIEEMQPTSPLSIKTNSMIVTDFND